MVTDVKLKFLMCARCTLFFNILIVLHKLVVCNKPYLNKILLCMIYYVVYQNILF